MFLFCAGVGLGFLFGASLGCYYERRHIFKSLGLPLDWEIGIASFYVRLWKLLVLKQHVFVLPEMKKEGKFKLEGLEEIEEEESKKD